MAAAFFCTFHDERGDTVYVNPLLVRYFTSTQADGGSTRIVFDDRHSLLVKDSPVDVHNGLCTYHSSMEYNS